MILCVLIASDLTLKKLQSVFLCDVPAAASAHLKLNAER